MRGDVGGRPDHPLPLWAGLPGVRLHRGLGRGVRGCGEGQWMMQMPQGKAPRQRERGADPETREGETREGSEIRPRSRETDKASQRLRETRSALDTR